MQELRLVAVSEDGTYAVLATPGQGGRFALPIDDRLRIVARGQFSRLAQYDIEVERPLRPKEIQDRIRAGETAEEIAEAAGVPIDRVRRFEGPVLAERAHWALQAQDATVRQPGDSGPGQRLGDVVAERLSELGADPESVEWDSRKRPDGTWQVQLAFTAGGYPRAADWQFDPRRRHVAPDNDTAAGLCLPDAPLPSARPLGAATVTPIGARLNAVAGTDAASPRPDPAAAPAIRPAPPQAPPPRAPAPRAPAPRTPAPEASPPEVPAAQVPAQAPAPPAQPAPRRAVPAQTPRVQTAATAPAATAPASAPAATAPAATAPASATPAAPAAPAPASATPAATAPSQPAPARERPARKTASGRSRRSSVPSWDEIMFGTSRQSDEA